MLTPPKQQHTTAPEGPPPLADCAFAISGCLVTKKQPRVKVKRRAARSIRLDKNLIITQKRDDLAQNGNLCDDNRLKRIVLRLKAKMAVFLIKALYRRPSSIIATTISPLRASGVCSTTTISPS